MRFPVLLLPLMFLALFGCAVPPQIESIGSPVSGKTGDTEQAPRVDLGSHLISEITPGFPGSEEAVLNIQREDRTYYFNNNKDRLCFGFSLSGQWKPTEQSGLLVSANGKEHAGALVLSEEDLKGLQGEDLLSRAVSAHVLSFQRAQGKPANSSVVEPFKSTYSKSIKWTGRWHFSGQGRTYIAEVVRYMVVVKPGWVAVVTASHGTDGDDSATEILRSMTISDEPDCYRSRIHELMKAE